MSQTIEELQTMVSNLEAQIVELYSEKSQMPVPLNQAASTIASLEEQVVSLVDEKMSLEKSLNERHQQIERLKLKSKVLGAAILEAALFDTSETTERKVA